MTDIEVEEMYQKRTRVTQFLSLALALSQVALMTRCGGAAENTEIKLPDGEEDQSASPTWDDAPPHGNAPGQMFVPPDMDEASDSFGVLISRSYSDVGEATLIRDAEAIQPNREDVLLMIGSPAKQSLIGVEPDIPIWWYDMFDGVRIPYAITSDAISYYVDVVKQFENGDFATTNDLKILKAFVKYEASVEYVDEYQLGSTVHHDVSIVHMQLSWSQYCGPECAMGFFKNRTVVFDDSGAVIAVFDDGATKYVVS